MPRVNSPTNQIPVKLITLTPAKFTIDNVPVPLPDQLWRMLVFLNESAGRFVGREELCELLWDTTDTIKARHSLSQLLYVARKKLKGVSIEGSDHSIRLACRIPSDLTDLTDSIARGNYAQIACLYNGDFLPAESETSSASFQLWRDQKAASIHRLVVVAYQQGVTKTFNETDWETCIEIGRCLSALDSLDSASARAVRDAEVALETPLRQEKIARTPTRFVGRRHELSELRSEYDLASVFTDTIAVVIRGESGVGKTRLATHFGRAIALQGDSVLMARCFEAEQHVPFAPVVQMLESVPPSKIHTLPRRMRAALAALHPKFLEGTDVEFGDTVPSKIFLFESITAAVGIAAAQRKCLLIFDDIQWCDEATSEWLHHFHRSQSNYAHVLLVTVRSDLPNLGGYLHWTTTSENSRFVDLGALSGDESRALLAECLTRNRISLPSERFHRIQELCSGHPLYIMAVADSLTNGDVQNVMDGEVALVPDAIKSLVSRRVERLSPEAQRLAETLACISDDASISELAEFSELGPIAVVHAGTELVNARLIRTDDLRFSHDLIKRSIYECLSTFAKRARHERIYRTTPKISPASRAIHALKAGLREETYTESVAAGEEAVRIHAYLEAVHHYETALQAAAGDEQRNLVALSLIQLLNNLKWHKKASELAITSRRWCVKNGNRAGLVLCDLTILVSELAAGQRPASEFLDEIKRLIDSAAACGSPTYAMQVLRLATFVAHLIGDVEELNDIFATVEATTSQLDSASRAELTSAMSTAVAPKDRARAIELSDKALELAEKVGEPWARAIVLGHRGSIHTLYGEIEQALRYFDRAEEACTDGALSDVLVYVYANRACILYDQGRFVEGHQQNAKAMRCASHVPLIPLLNAAVAYLDDNQFDEAITWATKTLHANSQLNVSWIEMGASTIRGLAYLGLGDLTQAVMEGDKVSKLIDIAESATTDMSYTIIFLSSLDEAQGRSTEAMQRLEKGLQKKHVDPFARCRMEIALSGLVANMDVDRAYALAKAALNRAEGVNSVLLRGKAAASLERLRHAT